ncbi:putative aldehyde dehydrogenase [Mycolicibacterium chitae]|uniref:aldehyde dehydrogenase (NAD(+)) n=1 Tax=Mycolicibacterium chitae TaxID=1792 RepID=A0A3S4RPH9_MYCCI|nr:aldehyde dehydrogenase [Mycolicibacterium chitae]MCV7105079.1 aldehyde dehydrogenase [Mycolicibacterium chitae]BBZ05640.1 putative aldehyde dehydrogenase [Mycolicibacterium chitae]VEG49252.1 NAD-dependent aldehyde dehydrogenase [Mycolicibacterium chitae]
MTNREELLIDGQWRKPKSTERLSVISASTEEVIGSVSDAGGEDVDAAVTAARRSFDEGTWRRLGVDERAEILERALQILEPKLDEVANVVTSEMGLPTSIAQVQIPSALGTARFFIDVAKNEPIAELRPGQTTAAVVKEPVGVVASIAPWNGPFNMAVNKITAPLVAGCSVVFKPAAETPLDVFYYAEALAEAGVPAGVFNLITGHRDTGRALVNHPGVDKVSFTGSTVAGREIGEVCGRSFKRMQLELGGKSAAIILEDADIPTTMQGLAVGSFFNTGQVCAAYSRVLVPRTRYDEIVDALVATAESFVVGDPFDPATTMGPLVSQQQRERVEGYISIGVDEGAKILTGGGRPAGLDRGWFVQPTVFGSADNSMRICQEEIFGPVTTVMTYDNLEEAIAIANDSDYGLHGAVFTADDEAALRVAQAVRTGTFSVNSFNYNTEAPFGGVKCSGVGRDTGREGLTAYYELKTINLTPGMERLFS